MTGLDERTRRELRFLRTYTLAATALLGVVSLAAFRRAGESARFEEITVERINVVEPGGKLRLVIANRERSPAQFSHGKTFGRPGQRPGMIFYNDEGDENGGLAFFGKRENGKVTAFSGLMFDQYDQDQVIALQYIERDGRRRMGLQVLDRPDVALVDVIERQQAIARMPEGPAKDSAWRQLAAYQGGVPFGAPRLFVGRDTSKAAVVNLSDKTGRVRLRLAVDSAGGARIEFLDDSGRVTYRLPEPAGAPAAPRGR
jgi:hypothetical protein